MRGGARLREARRALQGDAAPRFGWVADGLASNHDVPFLRDPEWQRHYDVMIEHWRPGIDVRWRVWLLTRFARHADGLAGAFAEFGTYRGGCAYMMLACSERAPLWMYDTFAGLPAAHLDAGEATRGMGGQYADTSVEKVESLLAPWAERTEFAAGDVFDTVPARDPGPLALAHLDLNAAKPTAHVLPFAYERLVPGGVLVFDDYGFDEYAEQREVLDAFFADRPEPVVSLPTAQAFVIKL